MRASIARALLTGLAFLMLGCAKSPKAQLVLGLDAPGYMDEATGDIKVSQAGTTVVRVTNPYTFPVTFRPQLDPSQVRLKSLQTSDPSCPSLFSPPQFQPPDQSTLSLTLAAKSCGELELVAQLKDGDAPVAGHINLLAQDGSKMASANLRAEWQKF
jgi:hypothetical protein